MVENLTATVQDLSCRTGEDPASCQAAITDLIGSTGCSTAYAVDALATYAKKGLRIDVVAEALTSQT